MHFLNTHARSREKKKERKKLIFGKNREMCAVTILYIYYYPVRVCLSVAVAMYLSAPPPTTQHDSVYGCE